MSEKKSQPEEIMSFNKITNTKKDRHDIRESWE